MAKQTQSASTASPKETLKAILPEKILTAVIYIYHQQAFTCSKLEFNEWRILQNWWWSVRPRLQYSQNCKMQHKLCAYCRYPSRLSFLTQCVPCLFVSRSYSDPAIGQVMTSDSAIGQVMAVRKSGGDCKNAWPFTTAGAPWGVNMGCQIQANLWVCKRH